MTVGEIVGEARKKGLGGVAICDHDVLSSDSANFAAPDGFILIRGEEFSTEYGHVLGLFLTDGIGKAGFHETVKAIREGGGIAVLAHPFERCADPYKFDPVISELDGIEVTNGRANRKNRRANEMAAELAKRCSLPAFGGSDAHVAREIGNGFVTIEVDEITEDAVRRALLTVGNETGGRNGKRIDVAKSQLTKIKKTGGGPAKRLKWFAFAVKCAAGDIFGRK